MKDQILRHARALLSPLLLLVFTAPVVTAGKTGSPAAPATPDQQLLVNLMVMFPNNVEALADGLRIRFNTGYLKSTVDDILKMNNFAENISSYRESKELIVEKRPPIELYDTVYLRLTHTTPRDYRLKMYTRDFSKDKIAILEDSWLDRYQVIDLGGDTTNFNFSVTSDPASQASNRFRVIFVGHSILPVHFTGISAMAAPGNIKLLWTAADDKDVTRYEIERSSNGVDFLTAGTVLPGGNGAYTWLDQSPLKGNNYYRVRSISLSGEIIYSKVVRASLFTDAGGITVYPNPVAGHMLNLSLSGMKADVYTISLLNNLGQPVMQQPLKHGGGNAAYTIRLNSELPPGKYSLLIQQPGESPQQKSLLIL